MHENRGLNMTTQTPLFECLGAGTEPGFQLSGGPKKKFRSGGGQKNFLTQIICIYVYLLFKLH